MIRIINNNNIYYLDYKLYGYTDGVAVVVVEEEEGNFIYYYTKTTKRK